MKNQNISSFDPTKRCENVFTNVRHCLHQNADNIIDTCYMAFTTLFVYVRHNLNAKEAESKTFLEAGLHVIISEFNIPDWEKLVLTRHIRTPNYVNYSNLDFYWVLI